MRINPTLEKSLTTTTIGRAKLKLLFKLSGRDGFMPTQKQRDEFIEGYAKDQFIFAEFYGYLLTLGDCRVKTFKGKSNLANFNSALKKLDLFPIDKPLFYQFKSKYYETELCAFIKVDKLADVEGYVYTIIIFDDTSLPDAILSMVEIRSSQQAPEPAFNALAGNDWEVTAKTDPEIFKNPVTSMCIDLLIDLANSHLNSLVSFEQITRPGFKKNQIGDVPGPKDKILVKLLNSLGKNKAFCFLAEVPLEQIYPFSYEHCFEIPLYVIEYAESVIENEGFSMLVYESGDMFIMSDCYPAYMAFRKMQHKNVKVVIIGEEAPRSVTVIKKGGIELIPPVMSISSGGYDNLDRPIKDLLLGKYIKRLSVLDSSQQIANAQCVLLTEDSKSTEMIEALLLSSEFNIDETTIISYRNCTNLDSLGITIGMIKNINPYATVLIHRDRDYLLENEIKDIVIRIEDAGGVPFITNGTDIESYFINAEHITKTYPSLSIEFVNTCIETATQQTRTESIEFIKKHDHGDKHKTKQSYLDEFTSKIYESDKARYRHGKKTLGILKALLQKELSKNVHLYNATPALNDANLCKIARQIWPYELTASAGEVVVR